MMTNPLIEKYNELYNPKPPEPPKPVEKPKLSKLKSYDLDDLKISFQQIAEQVKNGEAQVSSMSMESNAHLALKTITFEVMFYEP
jgi:hypothetical protein